MRVAVPEAMKHDDVPSQRFAKRRERTLGLPVGSWIDSICCYHALSAYHGLVRVPLPIDGSLTDRLRR